MPSRYPEEWTTSFARGMNDSAAAVAYQDNEAALLLNYRVTPDGQAEVRRGSQKTHTTALNSAAQGYGGFEFRTAASVVQWCVFVGDKFYTSTDEGASWTQQATGLRTDYWSLVTMRVSTTNYLLCANGGTNSYKWDGTTWATISNIDSGVKYLAVHNDRLWSYASGISIKASKIADFETWATPDGLSLPIQTHDGDNGITAMFSLGAILLVFKRDSTAYVDGYGNSSIIVAAGSKGISRDVGCIAFRSLKACGGRGIIWLSERGFEFYSPGGEPVLVSGQVQKFMDQIAWSEIKDAPGLPEGIFYPRKLTYECAIPGAGTQNNYTFVYRLPTGASPGAPSLLTHGAATGYTMYVADDSYLALQTDATRLQCRTNGGYLTIGTVPGLYVEVDDDGYLSFASVGYDPAVLFTADRGEENQAPVGIGYDGFVRLFDYGENDDAASTGSGGTSIAARLRPRPLLFSNPFRKKWGRLIRIIAATDSTATVTASLIADGTEGTSFDLSLAASADGSAPREVHARPSGRGFTLQAQVETTKAGLKVSAVGVGAQVLAGMP
jgi:hypothetical protein